MTVGSSPNLTFSWVWLLTHRFNSQGELHSFTSWSRHNSKRQNILHLLPLHRNGMNINSHFLWAVEKRASWTSAALCQHTECWRGWAEEEGKGEKNKIIGPNRLSSVATPRVNNFFVFLILIIPIKLSFKSLILIIKQQKITWASIRRRWRSNLWGDHFVDYYVLSQMRVWRS